MKLILASLALAAIAVAQLPPPCPPICPDGKGGPGRKVQKKVVKQQKPAVDSQKKSSK
jgi:hypothetical protein